MKPNRRYRVLRRTYTLGAFVHEAFMPQRQTWWWWRDLNQGTWVKTLDTAREIIRIDLQVGTTVVWHS